MDRPIAVALAIETCEQCSRPCPEPAVNDAWLCTDCALTRADVHSLRWRADPKPVSPQPDRWPRAVCALLVGAACLGAWAAAVWLLAFTF